MADTGLPAEATGGGTWDCHPRPCISLEDRAPLCKLYQGLSRLVKGAGEEHWGPMGEGERALSFPPLQAQALVAFMVQPDSHCLVLLTDCFRCTYLVPLKMVEVFWRVLLFPLIPCMGGIGHLELNNHSTVD